MREELECITGLEKIPNCMNKKLLNKEVGLGTM